MKSVISAKDLSVSYVLPAHKYTSLKELILKRGKSKQKAQTFQALSNVTFEMAKGESVALLGHNGCGKSTLLKVIAGVIRVAKDKLTAEGRIAPMIELGAGFDGELTGLENILLSCMLLGLTREETYERMDSIIAFSELEQFIEIPVKNYSSGMYARLGFACATAVDPDILLIDEVLSVGDANFGNKCLSRIHHLRERGTTIVLVSHDTNLVRRFCSRGIVLEQGILRFDGAVDEAVLAHDHIMEERQLRLLSKEEEIQQRRLLKLQQSTQNLEANPRPLVTMAYRLLQDHQEVAVLDLAKGFIIEVRLMIEHAERFHDDITVGIGINLPGLTRLGGCNNLQCGQKFDLEKVRSSRVLVINFEFSEGIPVLCEREYELIVGVHDESISRNISTQSLGIFAAKNSLHGINPDGDVLSIHSFNSSIYIQAHSPTSTS